MQPDERDAGYLWDMLDAARTVGQLIAGSSFHQYNNDRRTQLAVERAIEIIGEAAGRVSIAFQQAHPEIPWRQIIAQRNVLVHEYGEIKQYRLWRTATENIPKLCQILEKFTKI
jgi:uncharacterized protein with HEPN domain